MGFRIIPRLEVKGQNLVKGIHLEGLRVLGQPEQFAKRYYAEGADELFYVDVVASLYNRNYLLDIVRKTAEEVFIPLTVGGGIRTVEDVQAVLSAGADKIAINTAAVKNPELIKQLARRFGSSTIVVQIEAKKRPYGGYEVFIDNGREPSGIEVLKWARQAVDFGAGEIALVSIDRDGTGYGFDIELTHLVSSNISIPVVTIGGAGTVQHVSDVILRGKADAVGLSSLLHYHDIEQISQNSSTRPQFSKFANTCSLQDLKKHLNEFGIKCRYNDFSKHDEIKSSRYY